MVMAGEGSFYDFSAPVFGGRAGTLRLGISPEADNRIMKTTKKSLLFVALGVLAAALGITALISKRLTAPLSRLTQSASAMAEGNYSIELSGEGDDEVCRLAQAMGRMAQAVRVREKELLEINEELEAVNVRLHEYIGEVQHTRDELVKSKQDTAVIDTARAFLHHARQPLTYLIMAIELMTDDLAAEGKLNPETLGGRLRAIQDASVRLSELLRKFELLKTYHPIEYDGTTKILDIDK
jgi:HAMP domain-containing protein